MNPPPTVVVTGPPRSGTSLLMQMLVAGGIDPVVDGRRDADANNVRGYFEHEGVTRLASDPSVLDGTGGRAVKVIHALLGHVPADLPLAVLFLHRDLGEVVASQGAMLKRLGRAAPAVPGDRLRAVFETQLRAARAALDARPGAAVLDVRHRAMVDGPAETAAAIAAFLNPLLGRELDAAAMAACVDPTLHRERH